MPEVRGLTLEASVLDLLDAVVRHPAPNDFAPLTQMPEAPITAQLALHYRW